MIRLNEEQLRNRVELIKGYMELDGSSYNLSTGEIRIQSLIGGAEYRKASFNKQGYAFYNLRERGKSNTVYLHHIVMILADADEYIKQMSEGMTINHISGVKTDNRLSNLEYLTSKDNFIHAYVMGLTEKPVEAKVNEYQAYEMLERFYQRGESLEELSEAFNIPVSTVKRIVIGKAHNPMFAMFKALNRSDMPEIKRGASKLTASSVRNILHDAFIEKMPQRAIAKKYNVSRSAIGMIVTGQRWADVYKEFTATREEVTA
ncbi:HNH endonuclease [Niallia taxi]|uniref:HNH nuclease domain-containing protein n=1 Tax=Niallia taxi TaxID=2499688 RepID=A0A437K4V0_9BACI|nr:HNH endonuclease [Niallia taxi]RVT57630.1 hypothetical protein EM808_24485 [Niallia taxi]